MTKDQNDRLRILVADDHDVVRAGVCAILSNNPLWKIVGEAENGRVAVDKAYELKPDAVILDISMPLLNGIEAAREIRQTLPGTKIVILTMHESPQLELAARQAGADALVTKRMAANSLTSAVERLFNVGACEVLKDSTTSDVTA